MRRRGFLTLGGSDLACSLPTTAETCIHRHGILVQQLTNFELTVNLKTAAALGRPIPLARLARANEVLE